MVRTMAKDFSKATGDVMDLFLTNKNAIKKNENNLANKCNDTKSDVIIKARERKTKRVQLLLTESTLKALDLKCKKLKVSRNELVEQLINNYIKGEN